MCPSMVVLLRPDMMNSLFALYVIRLSACNYLSCPYDIRNKTLTACSACLLAVVAKQGRGGLIDFVDRLLSLYTWDEEVTESSRCFSRGGSHIVLPSQNIHSSP